MTVLTAAERPGLSVGLREHAQTDDRASVFRSRLAGALYLVVIVTAGFAEAYSRGRLTVRGDAAATAANILGHETLFRLGGAADVVNLGCDVAICLLLYELFRPVGRSLAMYMAAFRFMGDAILAVVTVTHFAALLPFASLAYLRDLSQPELQAQALTALRLHSQGYNVAMVFFGVHLVLLGALAWRGRPLSKTLGSVLCVAGVCYVVNSFVRFVLPPVAALVSPYILWPGIAAEFGMALWLLGGMSVRDCVASTVSEGRSGP